MDSVVSSHPSERVKHLMQALPEYYCEVLNCRFLLNLSKRETATQLGRKYSICTLQNRYETHDGD